MNIPDSIARYIEQQRFAVVSTIDADGAVHCAIKAIVAILPDGRIRVIDLYRGRTFDNLVRDKRISLTVVDEHSFTGYTIKGISTIIEGKDIDLALIERWHQRVAKRVAHRLIKSVQGERRSAHHPEAQLPAPQYMIEISVQEIVDLAPAHLKGK